MCLKGFFFIIFTDRWEDWTTLIYYISVTKRYKITQVFHVVEPIEQAG